MDPLEAQDVNFDVDSFVARLDRDGDGSEVYEPEED